MKYITRKDGRNRETVDQFDTLKEARAMVREYQTADPSADYYVSGRACAGWRDEPAPATFATNGGTHKARNGGKRAPLDLSATPTPAAP